MNDSPNIMLALRAAFVILEQAYNAAANDDASTTWDRVKLLGAKSHVSTLLDCEISGAQYRRELLNASIR